MTRVNNNNCIINVVFNIISLIHFYYYEICISIYQILGNNPNVIFVFIINYPM